MIQVWNEQQHMASPDVSMFELYFVTSFLVLLAKQLLLVQFKAKYTFLFWSHEEAMICPTNLHLLFDLKVAISKVNTQIPQSHN